VRWFLAPQPSFNAAGTDAFGAWEPPHNIYLSQLAVADTARYFTVRHEILHDLVGHGGHPSVFGRCRLLRE
jgi:Zn-dependent peptidase ImmA (M78 family)